MRYAAFFLIAALSLGAFSSKTAEAGRRRDNAKEAALAWSACLENSVRRYATTAETAPIVIDAAFGNCVSESGAFQASLVDASRDSFGIGDPASEETRQRWYDQIKEALRQKMTSLLLDLRTK